MGQHKVDEGYQWSSVTLLQTPMGLIVREKFERFKLEAMSELVLRLTGGLMVAGSMLLWLVLPMEQATEQMISHGLLAAMCTAIGLIVYAYGTRGFRRQVALDTKLGSLTLTKININHQSRVSRTIQVDKIDSLFLRRPSGRPGFASLFVRVGGSKTPQLALTGETAELELVHQKLCELVQSKDNGLDPSYRRIRREARGLAPVRI
jgi:hypothetical protein